MREELQAPAQAGVCVCVHVHVHVCIKLKWFWSVAFQILSKMYVFRVENGLPYSMTHDGNNGAILDALPNVPWGNKNIYENHTV